MPLSNDAAALLDQVEHAEATRLARLLVSVTDDQARLLRRRFGPVIFECMAGIARDIELAQQQSRWRARLVESDDGRTCRGHVVLLPGLMGSHLDTLDLASGDRDWIWLNYLRLVLGRLARLELQPDGRTNADSHLVVRPSGLLKDYYGAIALRLVANGWSVIEAPYDWRLGLDHLADQLARTLDERLGPDEPFHMVAHSMGGLVARTFIARHPLRWARAFDDGNARREPGTRGGRLVMIGTPNHGSYLVAQVFTGVARTLRLLARVDPFHDLASLGRIINTFPGLYHMLPSPCEDPKAEPLYRAATYARLARRIEVSQVHLDAARDHHESLRSIVDPRRMVYIAGDAQTTIAGICDWDRFDQPSCATTAYLAHRHGDGSVDHALGRLAGVPTVYEPAAHELLPGRPAVLDAIDELLTTGWTTRLSPAPARALGAPRLSPELLLRARETLIERDLDHASRLLRPSSSTAACSGEPAVVPELHRLLANTPPAAPGFGSIPRPHAPVTPSSAAQPEPPGRF